MGFSLCGLFADFINVFRCFFFICCLLSWFMHAFCIWFFVVWEFSLARFDGFPDLLFVVAIVLFSGFDLWWGIYLVFCSNFWKPLLVFWWCLLLLMVFRLGFYGVGISLPATTYNFCFFMLCSVFVFKGAENFGTHCLCNVVLLLVVSAGRLWWYFDSFLE